MYVTRPLSLMLKSAEILAAAPDGPNSGYLVIQDEESETYSFFGLHKNRTLKNLPFPQDKELTVRYSTTSASSHDHPHHHNHDDDNPLFLIPALNHPLSSDLYYAIVPHKKRIGEALTCSREEDKATCCFCSFITDVKPRPLDPTNIYQHFQILPYHKTFTATSIASDGFPPDFLRRKGWTIRAHTPENFKLGEARGLDSHLRARLPELDSTVSVGKWYTPFVFVKEGTLTTLRDQVKRSMYYEVTLEQRWDRIFSCKRMAMDHNQGNSVVVDAAFEKEQVFVGGSRAKWNEKSAVDGVVWFNGDGGGGVGLRVELVERMKWEEERGGWIGGGGGEVKINRVEEFENEGGGGGGWNEFVCYVLVERFNLKRMDGSLVMSYDFKHSHHLKTKWD